MNYFNGRVCIKFDFFIFKNMKEEIVFCYLKNVLLYKLIIIVIFDVCL